MIRFILVILFLTIYFLCSLIVLPVLALIGHFNPKKKQHMSQTIVKFGFRCILFFAGTHVDVEGLENVPKDEAVLFIANHRSFFDVIISYCYIPGTCGIIAKKEFEKYPLLSNWMRNIHCIFLDRKNIRAGMKSIMEGIEEVKSGTSILIFPEGTRNKGEGISEFHAGSFKLATKPKAKVVPMILTNTAEAFENQFPRVKSVHSKLVFMKPVDTNVLDKEALNTLPEDLRKNMLQVYETLK